MSFNLKNAGVTYQCMMFGMFRHLLGKVIEVYINDVIKIKVLQQPSSLLSRSFSIDEVAPSMIEPRQMGLRGQIQEVLWLSCE